MALGAALATGKPQAYVGGAGPGPAQFRRRAAHRLRHERAGAGADRANPRGGDRQGPGPPARDPRSGRHHRPAGRSFVPHQTVRRSLRQGREGDCIHEPAAAPVRPRSNAPSTSGASADRCRQSCRPSPLRPPKIDDDKVRAAAKLLGKAKRVLIVAGGGAQDASAEVTLLSEHVAGARAGLSARARRARFAAIRSASRCRSAANCGREADAVLAVGTRLLNPLTQWGIDKGLQIVRVDADPEEPARLHKPKVALIGDAAPILRQLIDSARQIQHAPRIAPRRDAGSARRSCASGLRSLRRSLPSSRRSAPSCRRTASIVDEVTQIGFAARLAFPVYKPRTFLSPGYQDNLGWGYATALGAQHARPDVPVLSINGDGGFLYTGNELATAIRHRIPLVAVVFVDGAFGNVRRIQQEQFGNRLIACDLANPDFVKYAESFGAAGRRARDPDELRVALRGIVCAPRTDPDRGAGWGHAKPLGIHPHAARARNMKRVAMTEPDRVRLPATMDLITTTDDLAAVCARMAKHPFVTVDTEFLRETTYYPLLCVAQMASPEEAVVIDALATGIDLAPFFALMANEKRRQGFSCRAAGHRNRLEHGEDDPASDRRHPGRRHGARLRRLDLLRPAGPAHHRRHTRQIAPLHRLDPAPAQRRADCLRAVRRNPSARRLSRSLRPIWTSAGAAIGSRPRWTCSPRRKPIAPIRNARGSGSRAACASRKSWRC